MKTQRENRPILQGGQGHTPGDIEASAKIVAFCAVAMIILLAAAAIAQCLK